MKDSNYPQDYDGSFPMSADDRRIAAREDEWENYQYCLQRAAGVMTYRNNRK